MVTKRLLLIEDDPDVAEMLLMYFGAHKYNIMHADSGTAGVAMARTRFPHLILLDLMLPDMDGYAIYRKLRDVSVTRYIPIIFLTQRNEAMYRIQGLQLGADDYVAKPFDIEELRLRVERSIERATRDQIQESRTGLPTGRLAEDEVSERIALGRSYQLIRFMVDGYALFRDVYGFITANLVIEFAGRAIQEAVNQRGTPDDFIGILEDDFVVLTYCPDPRPLIQAVQSAFATGVRAFYSFSDVERGGLLVSADDGSEKVVPLMRMAIVRE